MQLASGRPTMATITAADTRVSGMAFQTTLNGLGGNSRAPEPVHRSDLRLNKILPFGAEGRYKLTLNLEAFNVTINAQSYSERPRVWGRVTRWV